MKRYHQRWLLCAATVGVMPTISLAAPFQERPTEPPFQTRVETNIGPALPGTQAQVASAVEVPLDGAILPIVGVKPPMVFTPNESNTAIPDADIDQVTPLDLGSHLYDSVYYDYQGGAYWAMGRTYKARGDANGFSYMPFLGSAAPKTYELNMRLGSVTLGGEVLALDSSARASREGSRMVLDRGPVDVWYDLALESVEQSFALEVGGIDAELVLNLDVRTEFNLVEQSDGIAYLNDLGGVYYRHAFVIDAVGQRLELPIIAETGHVRLAVPAEYMKNAVAPIVVDPTFVTFSVHGGYAKNLQAPDVAYDFTTDTFAYAHQAEFSAGDNDVWVEYRTPSGTFLSLNYTDFTSSNVRGPSVANDNNSNQFLVASLRLNGSGFWEVIGRTLDAFNGAIQSPVFIIGDANANWQNLQVDVGGKSQGSSLFMAVWDRSFGSYTNGRASTVTPVIPLSTSVAPTVGSLQIVTNASTFNDTQIRISESSGEASLAEWRVAHIRTEISTGAQQLQTTRYADNGVLLAATTTLFSVNPSYQPVDLDISTGLVNLAGPFASGPVYCMPVYFLNGSDSDLYVYGVEGSSAFSETLLKSREHTPLTDRQRYPAVSATSTRFVVSYVEFDGNYTCHASALDLTNLKLWAVNDRRMVVAELGGNYDFLRPAIASRYSGGNYGSLYSGAAVSVFDGTYWTQSAALLYPYNGTSPAAQYCEGNVNSTGDRGFITMFGTPSVVGTKTLYAEAMALNQFGYFLAGQNGFGTTTIPGSAGINCLIGGPIGRYNGALEVFFTGTTGTATLSINPAALRTPTGNVVGLAGQTWNFQAWHRENGGSSNFTNAISLRLQ